MQWDTVIYAPKDNTILVHKEGHTIANVSEKHERLRLENQRDFE